ncbi:MAG: hypothetical protein JNK92_07815 [Dechloromonas sp.]|nr:hypothetical protein [Dechloromonas sp.]
MRLLKGIQAVNCGSWIQWASCGHQGSSRANPEPTTSPAAERRSGLLSLKSVVSKPMGNTMPPEALAFTHEIVFSGAERVVGWLQK